MEGIMQEVEGGGRESKEKDDSGYAEQRRTIA